MRQDKDAECGVGEPTGSRLGRDEPIAAVRVGYDEQGHFATASKLDVEDAQLRRVPWNSMVLVVAQHNLAKPFTDRGHTMMLSALKLGLDGFELRDHSLLRRNPPDDESAIFSETNLLDSNIVVQKSEFFGKRNLLFRQHLSRKRLAVALCH